MVTRQRGFGMVEVLTTCALAGVLAAVALPSWQGQLMKARRADAMTALGRLQAAQERHRAATGAYAAEFAALRLPAGSDDGLYTLAIELTAADRYRARADAVPGGPQAADAGCQQLVLDVASGFATSGPSARCWNR